MKLALISDLHSQKACLRSVEKISNQQKIGGIICSGDNTVGDDAEFIRQIFSILKREGKRGFFIWGNSDQENVRKEILENDFNIHLEKKEFLSLKIFGLSYMEDYVAFDSSLVKGSIFVTHQPPIQQALLKKCQNAPLMHISGHLHKKAFVKEYPATTHIQVPTLIDGRYALLDEKTKEVEFEYI
ncbi:MAG: Calcineurin-like phosphoesterase superfamily domain protein [candidate division WS2 bacterium ADurb.Bin280]|uniref:Calcineurin-like phosphoesterase superfamily domain protein n=1 Tax=candidate division WS2 bacterium ADurb.Bin280 TaxID=1852829 RepID=A0A1V5SG08_9BACT|nr:MAG: Calcineurin-like phosphoesterase superfamily domain protein [candidate division WS2 bacterium ADurb.Bin280]